MSIPEADWSVLRRGPPDNGLCHERLPGSLRAAPLNAVVLNDTSTSGHLGCCRVMRVLRQKLFRQDIRVCATSPVRHDWERDRRFLDALGRADLVVINGEGTLHDGRARGARLLRVVDHPARRQTPVILINALYQDNPLTWRRWLSRMALIVARDSRSACELSAVLDRRVDYLPDLTLCDGFVESARQRRGLLMGDSVKPKRRRALARALRGRAEAAHLSIKYPPWLKRLPRGLAPVGAWLAYNLCNGVLALRQPPIVWPDSEADFLERLAGASAHVTGRFHGIALSLVTRTPFLALRSNSWKVESLLSDAGLSPDRLVRPSELPQQLAHGLIPGFTATEKRALEGFVDHATRQSDLLFRRIRALPGPV